MMSEVWTRWQGQVINATFPLGHCLGSSDHSGVFLTRASAQDSAEVAIKLVPTNRALAELMLPRWKRAGGLAHPRLLPLLHWGGCQLEGLPYLYAVMEYADQTLAQLLIHRALTEEEAREMLVPILEGLAVLHSQDLVQGQLKPANVLVVGEELKLASDTARRLSEGAISAHAPTPYDPPEARVGGTSPAGDIWALGVTLFEALTRRLPTGLGQPGEVVVLPADFSPAFREVVTRCLSLDPQQRPGVAELRAFARGQAAEVVLAAPIQPTASIPTEPLAPPEAIEPLASNATIEMAALTVPPSFTSEEELPSPSPESLASPAAPAPPEPWTPEPALPPSVASPVFRDEPQPAPSELSPSEGEPAKPLGSLTLTVAALVILMLVWAAVRMFSSTPAPAPPPPPQAAVAPAAAVVAPGTASSTSAPAASVPAAASSGVHEVIPDVPLRARRTVRGHIKVWVRVIVNQDGTVFAAVPDRTGSSRYFQRLAMEAAKKWTFPPADSKAERLMQVRFDFSREGTTARSVPLH